MTRIKKSVLLGFFLLVVILFQYWARTKPRTKKIAAVSCQNYFPNQKYTHRDRIDKLRAFGHCFLQDNRVGKCRQIEHNLLPYFTGIPPTYTCNNDSYVMPVQECFWPSMKNNMRGRGIVISINDAKLNETLSLVRVLKFLNNTLPLELVHTGDLCPASQQQLIQEAELLTGCDQELTFVDASKSVRVRHFKSYHNKWIAALFNSFQEMILIDTDTVPFIDLETLFHKNKYVSSGTLFFKDRDLPIFISPQQVSLFESLLPLETDFNISIDQSKLLDNKFFKNRQKHLMESGVVVMNRTKTLPGLLVSTALYSWRNTRRAVYGDKDLFWLGQLIAGNDELEFNEQSAAAIGRINGDRLCSTQLGHFENHDLLWINGGVRKCKRESSLWDILLYRSNKTQESDPVDIQEAVIPMSFEQGSFYKDQSLGCRQKFYCAPVNGAELIHFNSSYLKQLNRVVEVWNS